METLKNRSYRHAVGVALPLLSPASPIAMGEAFCMHRFDLPPVTRCTRSSAISILPWKHLCSKERLVMLLLRLWDGKHIHCLFRRKLRRPHQRPNGRKAL